MTRPRARPSRRVVERLVRFVTDTLVRSRCELLHVTSSGDGSFRLSYETPLLHRIGVAGKLVPLRPRTGDPDGATATLQLAAAPDGTSPCDPDPFGLFTPVFLGVDPVRDLFVAFDPRRHFPGDEPLHVSISGEPIRTALSRGWHAWLREEYENEDDPGFAETLVGFARPNLVRYLLFERLAAGLDTGPREGLAGSFYDDVVRRSGSAGTFRPFPL